MSEPRLLIIEDDEPVLEAVVRLFSRGACKVETAASLAEGLEALNPPPDCLILDVRLPNGDGVEVLRRVWDSGLPIRVALCTGTNEQDHLKAVAGLSPEALLGRPVDLDALRQALGVPAV